MFESLKTVQKNAYAKRGITNDEQLNRFIPLHYKDYRTPANLKQLTFTEKGLDIAVLGNITSVKESTKNGKRITTIKAISKDGTPFSAIFMNRKNIGGFIASMAAYDVLFMGTFKKHPIFGYSIFNPIWTTKVQENLKIHPVYRKVKNIADSTFQNHLAETLHKGETDTIPQRLIGCYPDINDALNTVHYPSDMQSVNMGKARLILDDLVYLKAVLKEVDVEQSGEMRFSQKAAMERMLEALPYQLTNDQRATITDIIDKTTQGTIVKALIQGDVGCGKTIIAFALMRCANENGFQSILMAPTQILAQQHYDEFSKLVPQEEIAFMSGQLKASEKKKILASIENGKIRYVIGTTSVLSAVTKFQLLGLSIADEEHRFGVEQRDKIDGIHVHSITMSATPIPRSLANAIYGEHTQVYQILEKPAGRKPVITYYDDGSKTDKFLYKQLKNGTQAYVVCPLKDEADEESITANLKSVQEIYTEYKKKYEPLGFCVAMVTGETPSQEREQIFQSMQHGDIHILVSTTVIEVGINIPNANVMIIQDADRFGLATLHQLRGRVGRGKDQGYCILVSPKRENERIRIMCSTNDGFQIAEADLAERKSGNLLGIEQSGKNQLVEELIAYPQIAVDAKKIVEQMSAEEKQEHIKKYSKIYI